MAGTVSKFMKHSRFALAGLLFAVSIATAGTATFASPETAKAASCDPVNVVLCGLDGRSLDSAIHSFQASYQNGSNNHHNDLKAIYRWAGATNASVANMDSSNTKLGTLSRNGDIRVNGVLVGHHAHVAARFGGGQAGFTKIPGSDAWERATTTSFAENSAPVIVHFGADGNADFAVMISCGNAVKFPPVRQKHPQLSCVSLSKDKLSDLQFRFTAQAQAKDTTITKYVFDFGDGSTTVRTPREQTSTSHKFAKFDHDYTVRVTVFSTDFSGGRTSADCVKTVHTSQAPALVCDSLRSNNNGLNYTFFAAATATNATIRSYTFHLSDGTSPIVLNTSSRQANIKHTFAQHNARETVFVTVTGSNGLSTDQTVRCTLHFTTPKQNECKPGIPVGDQRCTECTPSGQMNACVPPTPPSTPAVLGASTLSNSGPGGLLGLFGITTTLGALVHHFILRRFLFS